jgi:hypothetical protein
MLGQCRSEGVVASLDRERLGRDTLDWKKTLIPGIFDEETRRKLLAFAADAMRDGIGMPAWDGLERSKAGREL